jgi:hypothetical protein
MRHQEKTALNPAQFAGTIRRQPEFLRSLPQERYEALPVNERREQMQQAMAKGALSLANKLEKEHGEYNLDANLYRLIGSLSSFRQNSHELGALRDKYGGVHSMPAAIKDRFYRCKEEVTEFNHVLREVINASASRFGFNDLLTFMTTMQTASGGREGIEEFQQDARSALVGMRNEMAFEQLLIHAGLDYEIGTLEQDAAGGDFIIEGIPVDVKASQAAADQARERSRSGGYDASGIIWSHIHFEDYEGQLTLPYEKNDEVFARLKPELDRILHPQGARHTA